MHQGRNFYPAPVSLKAYLLSTRNQQASLCISSTYLGALVPQEDFRCAVAFLDAKC